MEMIVIVLCLALLACTAYLLRKNYILKHDIYKFARSLDDSLNELINEKPLAPEVCFQDDLWGMIYEKLYRVSNIYVCRKEELSAEKENLKELVSDISHQTKTPLANIKLYIELMEGEALSEKSLEYLRKLEGQTDKLEFLFQSLVKMSRLETNSIKIQKRNEYIGNTLALALAAVVPKADRKKIQISVQYDEKLCLNHDKKWTGEAVFNILENAVKYTPERGKICISVNKEAVFTKISIKDTGKGIPAERQGAVFNRFYREPEVHEQEGLGIGLYLARQIISMQNGFIEVESQVNQGSTFTIYLPN